MGSLAILYLIFVNSLNLVIYLRIYLSVEFTGMDFGKIVFYIPPPLSPSNFLQIRDIANEHSMYHPSHSMAITGTPAD